MDSDILAHFMQVHKQLQSSRWNKADVRFSMQGDNLLDHSFPAFEDFVFAAVYFRQFIAPNDTLLKDAVSRYCKFVNCPIVEFWVAHELEVFEKTLDGDVFMLPGYTVRELFDAFIYGAGLMHKFPKESDRKRAKFLEIYDAPQKHKLLYALNMSLHDLLNHIGNVAVVVYRDYSHWLTDYGLPLPETRWHDRLFEISSANDRT